jgi:hypothetical protein
VRGGVGLLLNREVFHAKIVCSQLFRVNDKFIWFFRIKKNWCLVESLGPTIYVHMVEKALPRFLFSENNFFDSFCLSLSLFDQILHSYKRNELTFAKWSTQNTIVKFLSKNIFASQVQQMTKLKSKI